MFEMSSSSKSIFRLGVLLVAGLSLLPSLSVGQEQQAPQYTQAEYDAYQAVTAEANAAKKTGLVVQFLKDYPESQLRTHVVADFQQLMTKLYNAKNWSAIINYGKKVQAVDPENSLVIQLLAESYQQTGNFRQFVSFGEQTFAKKPSGNLAYHLAKAYKELNNLNKYISWGDKAIGLLPDNHELMLDLTKQLSASGRNAQAAKYASKCLVALKSATKPEQMAAPQWNQYTSHAYATSYYVVGQNAYESNQYAKAITNLDNSLKYYGKNDSAYYFLGQAHWRNRNTTMAIKSFAKAYVIGGQTATAAKQHLENLYKQTHRNSLVGLDRVIEQAKRELQ